MTVEGNLEFLFMEAKNNQLLECRKSYVSPTVNGGDLCPVKIIAEYSKKMKESGGQGFFFSSLYPTRLPIPGSTFSYDNARKLTIDALRHVGLEESELKHYGLHSPRIGAATNSSQFLSDLELQRSGRWTSQETPRTYVIPQEAAMTRMSMVLNEQIANV